MASVHQRAAGILQHANNSRATPATAALNSAAARQATRSLVRRCEMSCLRKEPYSMQKEPCSLRKEPGTLQEEPCIMKRAIQSAKKSPFSYIHKTVALPRKRLIYVNIEMVCDWRHTYAPLRRMVCDCRHTYAPLCKLVCDWRHTCAPLRKMVCVW